MIVDPVALAACPTPAALEAEVLSALGRHVGFDVAFSFALGGGAPTAIGLDGDALLAALRPGSVPAGELAPIKAAALRARGVAVDTRVLGEAPVRRTTYHRELAAPLGGRHTLLAFMSLRGRPFGTIMLGRTGSTFGAREVAEVERVLPAVSLARASFGVSFASPDVSPSLPAAPWTSRLGLPIAKRHGAGAPSLVVRDRRGYREMVATNAETGAEMVWSRSALDAPSRSGWPYVDLFHVAVAAGRTPRRVLFVGAGGGVGPRRFAELHPGVAITVVEVDRRVVDLARRWFALGAVPNVETIVDDGVRFVARSRAASWDVIVYDAFDEASLAPGLASRASFRATAAALAPGGTFAMNVIGTLDGEGPVADALEAARDVFADLRVVPVMTADETYAASARRNVVLVGRRAG